MPTIAGGVHPGHLHACYELLGPNVAYFLGGAVALHPHSVREGARLCLSVLEQAIQLATRAQKSGTDCSADLPESLLRKVESTKYRSSVVNYFSPQNIFTVGPEVAHPPLPFYRRELV
jgi:ribulose 1,5-bisphosphate carboxylase large subunit-like protein